MRIEQQQHGYRNGHKLLATSTTLDKRDQELVNRLSDISGSLSPGEALAPYLTGYPLPSGSYVLARTWLDPTARRAGCVITRSLILDGKDWAELERPASLINLLDHPLQGSAAPITLSLAASSTLLPPAYSESSATLVEAFFLEQRQPIVCFGEIHAELVALRLLQALWPGIRRTVAFCSFALQPRSIEGRPFDLLFAPKDARTRFSDWRGRKLDASGRLDREVRHPWTDDLARSIFLAPDPDYRQVDVLGLLRRDSEGAPSALRLSMLWRDLESQSKADPRAVLGLIDVLTAADLPPLEAALQAERLVGLASQVLPSSPPAEQAHHLALLLAKLPPFGLSTGAVATLTQLARNIAVGSPRATVELLDLLEGGSLADALAIGLGEGLGNTSRRTDALDVLATASIRSLIRIIVASQTCRDLLMDQSEPWAIRLSEALSHAHSDEMALLREALPGAIRLPEHAALIKPLFAGASEQSTTQMLNELRGGDNALFVPALRSALASALIPERAGELRSAVVACGDDPVFDDLLVETLLPVPEAIEWLVHDGSIGSRRRFSLLASYLVRLEFPALRKLALSHSRALEPAFRILVGSPTGEADLAAARVLGLQPELASADPKLVKRLLRALNEHGQRDLLVEVLPSLMSETTVQEIGELDDLIRLPSALACFERFSDQRLVDLVLPAGVRGQRWSRQTALLSNVLDLPAHHPLRAALVRHADVVSLRLDVARESNIDATFARVWAALLVSAINNREHRSLQAAATALGFVLRHPVESLAPVAFAAFPFVLWSADQPKGPIQYLGRALGLDFGNAKDMREALVRTYLHAGWPVSDLIVGAWAAGMAENVLAILKKKSGANAMLSEAGRAIRQRADLTTKSAKRIAELVADEVQARRR